KNAGHFGGNAGYFGHSGAFLYEIGLDSEVMTAFGAVDGPREGVVLLPVVLVVLEGARTEAGGLRGLHLEHLLLAVGGAVGADVVEDVENEPVVDVSEGRGVVVDEDDAQFVVRGEVVDVVDGYALL